MLGLVRREQKQLTEDVVDLDNTEVLQQVHLLAAEIQYIRFRYFDGSTWQDVWPGGGGANSLPQAVKIEIGFSPDADMLTNQSTDLLENTNFDLMGNVEDQAPVPGRYSLIVRLPTANAMMASLKSAQQGADNTLGAGLTGSSGLGGLGSGLGTSTLGKSTVSGGSGGTVRTGATGSSGAGSTARTGATGSSGAGSTARTGATGSSGAGSTARTGSTGSTGTGTAGRSGSTGGSSSGGGSSGRTVQLRLGQQGALKECCARMYVM